MRSFTRATGSDSTHRSGRTARRLRRRAEAIGLVVALVVSLLAVVNGTAAAGSSRVVVRPGESIQAAIDAAAPGTTIVVQKGTYVENLWISTDGITLTGKRGATLVTPETPTTELCEPGVPGTVLVCVAPVGLFASETLPPPVRDVTVEGFTLRDSGFDAITAFFTDGLKLRRNKIINPSCDGVFLLFSTNFLIDRNSVSGALCSGLHPASSSDGKVSWNRVFDSDGSGIQIDDVENVKVLRNSSSDNCAGIVVLDNPDFGNGVQDEDFPARNVTVNRNNVNANNKTCPFGPSTVGGAGIILAGVSDALITRNIANDNVVNETSVSAGGIFVSDYPEVPAEGPFPGRPALPSNDIQVTRNTANGNSSPDGPADLALVLSGSVAVDRNKCGVSIPDPTWCGGEAPPKNPVFAEGGVLAGSTNGISFAPDGSLYVANVFGATITQIDPDSGAIISRLTAADGVLFPDDVIVAEDGTIYWTDIAIGAVMKKPVGEAAFPVVAPGGLNSANPLTLTDDGRLFAAGCYGNDNNSFVEIDPENGGIVNVLFGPVSDCASNGMSWYDGYLYSPQPFLDEIWRVDPDTGATEVVTENYAAPIGTAFDSDGNLYSLAQGVGEVVRVDIDNPDTRNNRTVIAEIPFGWADNIAVDDDDRIFISSATDSTIAEVLDNGKLRTVVPGQFSLPLGVNVIGNTLYTTNSQAIVGFDRTTREQTSVARFPAGFGYPFVLSSVAWGNNLVLMSAFSGETVLWDPVANGPIVTGSVPVFPIDGEPFEDDLIVTTAAPTGDIVRMDADLNPIGLVANVPGATGIAAHDGDVYVADGDDGTIVQIIDDGVELPTPVEVFTGLDSPEGIDIANNRLYVVEGGSETLTSIDLASGERETIATDLGLQAAALPDFFSFGFLNNVTVAGDDIYVNADRANVIYEF